MPLTYQITEIAPFVRTHFLDTILSKYHDRIHESIRNITDPLIINIHLEQYLYELLQMKEKFRKALHFRIKE